MAMQVRDAIFDQKLGGGEAINIFYRPRKWFGAKISCRVGGPAFFQGGQVPLAPSVAGAGHDIKRFLFRATSPKS